MANSLARSQGAISARLGEGLAFLATVGSTAPFIGLFGTVVGIYRALIKIGCVRSGVDRHRRRPGRRGADHDRARPGRRGSGGAAYNWLIRRNKSIMEDLAAFTNDLHGYLMSGGAVKPVPGRRLERLRRPGPAGAPAQPGSEPRTGRRRRPVIATSQVRPGRPGRALFGGSKGKIPALWQDQWSKTVKTNPMSDINVAAGRRDARAPDHLPDHRAGGVAVGSGEAAEGRYEATTTKPENV